MMCVYCFFSFSFMDIPSFAYLLSPQISPYTITEIHTVFIRKTAVLLCNLIPVCNLLRIPCQWIYSDLVSAGLHMADKCSDMIVRDFHGIFRLCFLFRQDNLCHPADHTVGNTIPHSRSPVDIIPNRIIN